MTTFLPPSLHPPPTTITWASSIITLPSPSKPSDFTAEGLPKATKVNGRYVTPWDIGACNKGLGDLMKWMGGRFHNRLTNKSNLLPPSQNDVSTNTERGVPRVDFVNPSSSNVYDNGCSLTWLGHATCLYTLKGINILTDPVFSQRCSPSSFVGPIRYTAPAVSISEMKVLNVDIDVVVISHDHYDHLDVPSLTELSKVYPDVIYHVPMGIKNVLTNECKIKPGNVVEMEWWDTSKFTKTKASGEKEKEVSVEVVCVPCQHWCCRVPWDRDVRLWSSWVIRELSSTSPQSPEGGEAKEPLKSLFFPGDTGLPESFPLFSQIGLKYGPFSLSSIPIGAYHPRWFMADQHCDPEQALTIHKQLGSRRSCGIHWGTWLLADESYYDPVVELKRVCDWDGADFNREFTVLSLGETMTDDKGWREGVDVNQVFRGVLDAGEVKK